MRSKKERLEALKEAAGYTYEGNMRKDILNWIDHELEEDENEKAAMKLLIPDLLDITDRYAAFTHELKEKAESRSLVYSYEIKELAEKYEIF